MSGRPRHGCPADRGSADAWYNRLPCPHYITADSQRVEEDKMTPAEIAEYRAAYDGEEGRKDWGD